MATQFSAATERPVEVWNGDRKVSVYDDTVLRVEGPQNGAIGIHEDPRTHDTVNAAFQWLFNGVAQPSAGIATMERLASPVASEKVMLPRKLTAENGAKYALIGEFFEQYEYIDHDEDGDEVVKTGTVPVRWDTIKRIWDRAVAHFEALDKQEGGSMVRDQGVPHGPEPTT